MTKIITFVLICFFPIITALQAQTPQLLNYQGKLFNKDGTALSGTFPIIFSIYSDSTGGTALWDEPRDVTVTNGIFNVLLGSVRSFPDTLFTGSGDQYLGIKIGTDPEMKPRFRLTSVPYSLKTATHQKVAFSAYVANRLEDNREPLLLQAVSNNIGDCYDPQSSTFTAPVNGVYLFSMSGLSWADTLGEFHALEWNLMVNGKYANNEGLGIIETNQPSSLIWLRDKIMASRTVIIYLKKGDKVHIKQTAEKAWADTFRSGWEGVLLYADPE